jgi:hypothetical protein
MEARIPMDIQCPTPSSSREVNMPFLFREALADVL